MLIAAQINCRLVGRVRSLALVRAGVTLCAGGGLAALAVVLVGGLGIVALLIPVFVVISSLGVVLPNTAALALADHGAVAGAASALIGVLQWLLAAVAVPLVGLAGADTALPTAALMALLGLGAVAALRLTVPGPQHRSEPGSAGSPYIRLGCPF